MRSSLTWPNSRPNEKISLNTWVVSVSCIDILRLAQLLNYKESKDTFKPKFIEFMLMSSLWTNCKKTSSNAKFSSQVWSLLAPVLCCVRLGCQNSCEYMPEPCKKIKRYINTQKEIKMLYSQLLYVNCDQKPRNVKRALPSSVTGLAWPSYIPSIVSLLAHQQCLTGTDVCFQVSASATHALMISVSNSSKLKPTTGWLVLNFPREILNVQILHG